MQIAGLERKRISLNTLIEGELARHKQSLDSLKTDRCIR